MSFYCLHWVQNQRQAVKNIYNLLLPGGDCLLVLLAKNPIFVIYEAMAQNPKWSSYMKDFARFTSPYQHSKDPEAEFKEHLTSAGFTNINCEARNKVFIYEGLEILQKSVKAVNPFAERIPKHLHEEYFREYYDIVKEVCYLDLCDSNNNDSGDENVKVFTPYTLIVAYATK